MVDFLTLGLYAPLAAMGGIAVGPVRSGWDRPARSALFGMIGAALGADRTDEETHQALERDLGIAMLVERPGDTLIDFHTTQAPSGEKTWRSRYEELSHLKPKDNPVVSHREYRTDTLCLLALWRRDPAGRSPITLDRLAAALRAPRYVVFAGRKACPLGLPLHPRVIPADTPVAALLERRKSGPEGFVRRQIAARAAPYVTLDRRDLEGFGLKSSRSATRPDRLLHRGRWQFAPREEAILTLDSLG